MKKTLLSLFLIFTFLPIFTQSIFNSEENQYYYFLNLSGTLESPTLNYKSLSDLNYNFSLLNNKNNVWSFIQFDKYNNISQDFTYKIFSPEIFMSYNTASPYGVNDEALWQGKGFNTELTGGVHLNYKGLNLTFLPEIIKFSSSKLISSTL